MGNSIFGRKVIIGFILIAVGLSGCREKTEEEKLADFKSSLNYKAYRLASDKITDSSVAIYNKSQPADRHTDARTVHGILSILWFLQQKEKYCYIEADFLENADNDEGRELILSLKTLALYKMGLKQLSREHYTALTELLAIEEGKTSAEIGLEHKLLLSSLIAVGFMHNDWSMAGWAAESLQVVTGVDYIVPLVGAMAEAKAGNPIKACNEFRKLASNERFAVHLREAMVKAADTIARSETDDREQLVQDVMQTVCVELVQQVLDDIFTADEKSALLDQIRKLPEKITAGQDGKDPPQDP